MPEVSKTEIGRRLFHVQREKGVESAIKKIKAGIGSEWRSFTQDEIRILGHLLQCTWNTIERNTWEKIPFGKISRNDVRMLLSHGEGISPGRNPSPESVLEVKNFLLNIT